MKHLLILTSFLPAVAFAQSAPLARQSTPQKLSDLIDIALWILNYSIGLLIALGVIYFLWGVVKFINAADNEEKLEDGKKTIVYGLLAVFVMVSIFGLVGVLVQTVFPY